MVEGTEEGVREIQGLMEMCHKVLMIPIKEVEFKKLN